MIFHLITHLTQKNDFCHIEHSEISPNSANRKP